MVRSFWKRWLNRLQSHLGTPSRRAKPRRGKRTILRLEALEDRTVPTAFTPGDIAVVDLAVAGSKNTTASILELNPTTANQTSPVQIISIASTGTDAMRFSDSGTSSFLSLTNDGTLLTFAAYNTTDDTTSDLASTTTSDRAVGTLDGNANFTLQTTYTGSSGNQTRSATSLNDSDFYITDKGGLYTNDATSPSLSTNILDARSFDGTVYVSSTKAAAGVSTVSSPTASSLSGLPGLAADGSIQDFYLIQSGSNGSSYDILYTLDQGKTSATINKFSYSSGSGLWVSNGSYTFTPNGEAMIAENDGNGGAYLYVTTGSGLANNSLVQLDDTAGYNATININTVNNATLYTLTDSSTLKGLDFVPMASAPVVTSISPTSGPLGGGTSVTITGTGFTDATAVNFGGTAAASFTINSYTSITAVSPAESAGTVDITVTSADGTSATSSADQFSLRCRADRHGHLADERSLGRRHQCDHHRHGLHGRHGGQLRRHGGNQLHDRLRHQHHRGQPG